MSYSGLQFALSDADSHLGGNIREGDPFTFSPLVWDYLIGRFSVKSALDLGSGLGYAANYFYKQGVQVVAVEGLKSNVQQAVYPTVFHDLTLGKFYCQVDLVHCQEVVEHIEEKYLDNLLSSLSCGKYLVITHALPGQKGHHHVNLQPTEYWVNHLKSYGCELLVEDSHRVRKLAQTEGAIYLQQSGLVFANRNRT